MSDLKILLATLPAKYNDSPNLLKNTLENIYQKITDKKYAKNTNTVLINVYSSICSNLEKINEEKYNIILKFMQDSLSIVGSNNRALYYIQAFIHHSLKENKIAEIRKFFVHFIILTPDTEDTLKQYFQLHVFYFSRIIFLHQPKPTEIEKFFKNLLIIFEETYKSFPSKFLEFSDAIFGKLDYINIIILAHPIECNGFLKGYFQLLRSLKNIETLDKLYIHLTTIFILFLQAESSKHILVSVSQQFLSACLDNVDIKSNKFFNYNLSISYHLNKLLQDSDNQKQTKFETILKKYNKFLERKEINDVYFKDGIVTFIEQLYYLSVQFSKDANKDNCELIFQILEVLLKYIYDIKVLKKICPKCNCNTIHQIYNICKIALNFYHRAITLNIINDNIDKYVLNIFRISLDCKEKFNCKRSEILLAILVQTCYKYIKDIKDAKRIKFGIALLNMISKSNKIETIGNISVLKLYLQYYEIIQNKKKKLMIQALIILNLTSSTEYYPHINYEIHNFINNLIDEKMSPNFFICDIIPDTEEHLKPKVSNINLILQQQICILAQKKLLTSQELENFVLKEINNIESQLGFALLVRNVNIITGKKLLNKTKDQIKNIKNNLIECNNKIQKFESHYALAILYKREAMQLFEELKNFMIGKSFTSDTIKELINQSFDNFNVHIENKAINIAILSINNFNNILEYLNDEKITKSINWIYLFDDISILARQFELRGYINHGYTAWKLIYNIATDIHNCNFEQMRAISYFCKYSQLINSLKLDKNFNLKNIIDYVSDTVLEKFKNMNSLTPRRQNYVLCCIVDIAYYYVQNNDLKSCTVLMNMILNKINQMESRQNIFELVRAKLCALEFNIVTKIPVILKRSPYLFIEEVLNNIRNIQYVTSEDSINIVNFLFNFIQEIVYHLMSINDIKSVFAFVVLITKNALVSGLILQTIHTLLLLAHMNLEIEASEDSQMNIVVVNKLMLMQNDLKIEYSPNKAYNDAKLDVSVDIFNISDNNLLNARQTRDISVNNALLPSNIKVILSPSKKSLNGHFNDHSTQCDCNSCKHPLLRIIQFKMGCLNARILYLDDKTLSAEEFFEKSFNWYDKIDSDYYKLNFNNFTIWMLIYYINALRSNKEYYKAIEICNYALNLMKKSIFKFDLGYYWKIIEQKEAAKYILCKIETIEIKKSILKKKVKNCLDECTDDLSQLVLEIEDNISKKVHAKEDLKQKKTFVVAKKQVKILQNKNENTTTLVKKSVLNKQTRNKNF